MTAFDGESTKVSVFFDSDGKEINVSLSDAPEDQVAEGVVALTPLEARLLREDLRVALAQRGEPVDLSTQECIELWGNLK